MELIAFEGGKFASDGGGVEEELAVLGSGCFRADAGQVLMFCEEQL